jgi:hypothetical protein
MISNMYKMTIREVISACHDHDYLLLRNFYTNSLIGVSCKYVIKTHSTLALPLDHYSRYSGFKVATFQEYITFKIPSR